MQDDSILGSTADNGEEVIPPRFIRNAADFIRCFILIAESMLVNWLYDPIWGIVSVFQEPLTRNLGPWDTKSSDVSRATTDKSANTLDEQEIPNQPSDHLVTAGEILDPCFFPVTVSQGIDDDFINRTSVSLTTGSWVDRPPLAYQNNGASDGDYPSLLSTPEETTASSLNGNSHQGISQQSHHTPAQAVNGTMPPVPDSDEGETCRDSESSNLATPMNQQNQLLALLSLLPASMTNNGNQAESTGTMDCTEGRTMLDLSFDARTGIPVLSPQPENEIQLAASPSVGDLTSECERHNMAVAGPDSSPQSASSQTTNHEQPSLTDSYISIETDMSPGRDGATETDISSLTCSQQEEMAASVLDESIRNSPPEHRNTEICGKPNNENPKEKLQHHYDQKDFNLKARNGNFIAWRELTDRAHVPLWTCYFVAPEGLAFPAGRFITLPRGTDASTEVDGLHWYATKKEAIHAAAGRGMDYFSFHDALMSQEPLPISRYCHEAPDMPLTMPPDKYLDKIVKINALLEKFH